MVKSSSRPRKASKLVVDLGPEIDKVVKKKDAKIKKQKVIIADLQERLRNRPDDMKVKKQKLVITSLLGNVNDLTTKLNNLDDELRKYKELKIDQGEVNKLRTKLNYHKNDRDDKDSKTIRGALQRALKGTQNPRNMQQRTIDLLKKAGRWEEAKSNYNLSKRSTPFKSIGLSMMR